MKLKFWQTRSWSPIMPPLKKLKSLTDTFFITNTPSIDEVEEFDRRDLDHKYTIHWRSWRVSQTRPWPQIIPPLKKLKSLTDTFLITNTPSINEAEEFDRHVLDHQYSLHWRSWRVWQTRSWSPILPPLKKLKFWQTRSWSPIMPPWSWRVWQTRSWSPILPPLMKLKSLTDTFLITNTPSIEEAEEFHIHPGTNNPSVEEAEEFDRHVLDQKYSLH